MENDIYIGPFYGLAQYLRIIREVLTMVKPIIYNTLRRLAAEEGIDLCYLITKKGNVLVGLGDVKKSIEVSFGTLTATIYGASLQTNKILEEKYPRRILVEDMKGYMMLKYIDKNHFLVLRIKKEMDTKTLEKEIENACWTLSQEI